MRVSFTRVIPRLGAGQAPSRLQFSTPSIPSIPSRSYSSLRPFSHTLTLNNNKNHRPSLSQRPKHPHSSHHNRRAFSLLPPPPPQQHQHPPPPPPPNPKPPPPPPPHPPRLLPPPPPRRLRRRLPNPPHHPAHDDRNPLVPDHPALRRLSQSPHPLPHH